MRVQLAGNPGLHGELRPGRRAHGGDARAHGRATGTFDAGNPRWYGWLSDRLLRFGSERDTRSLLQDLLGRPLSPDALLRQIERCRVSD